MKKIVLIISLILVIVLTFFGIKTFTKKENEFKKLGYSDNQIEIINTLKNPNIVLNYDYNEFIIELIKNENFIEENLDEYLEFSKYNFSIKDTMYIVNKNFYNEDINYDENIIALMKQQYYIHDNLERYLEYQKNNLLEFIDIESELQYVVKSVNSNLDYDYYTNTTPTDLSKGYLILVNKYNYLESDYVPENMVTIESKYGVNQPLNSEVYEKYKEMWLDASKEGLSLYINSPYRSYSTQNYLYNNYGKRDGYALADTYSARPGFSEHQTGLAFDITSRTTNFDTFASSKEYQWLQDNAHKYGFILRYPKGQERITGYQYESWHYRYVGIEVATKIKELNITFEEYYAYYIK